MSSHRPFAALSLITLTCSACATAPRPPSAAAPPPAPSTAASARASPDTAQPPEPTPAPPSESLIPRELWALVTGYDPTRGRIARSPAAERVTFFEALAFANRLSALHGLPQCYALTCAPHEADPADAPTPPAPSLHVGCPRLDQPFCVDPRACTAERLPGPCGFRLPTVAEWRERFLALRRSAPTDLAEWLWDDSRATLDSSSPAPVGGSTRLSSADTPPDRVAPTLTALKASHIGFRLMLDRPRDHTPDHAPDHTLGHTPGAAH